MKSCFLGAKLKGMELALKWYNPHTDPPSGQPRILWACSVPWPCDIDYCKGLFPDLPLTSGYVRTWSYFDLTPHTTWSPERKAKNRLRLMKQRIWKREPLFFDQMVAKKIASNPDYYDPAAIAKEDRLHKIRMAEYDEEQMKKFIKDCVK